jgi:hypothetical protein
MLLSTHLTRVVSVCSRGQKPLYLQNLRCKYHFAKRLIRNCHLSYLILRKLVAQCCVSTTIVLYFTDESVWAWRVCRFSIGRIVRFTVISYQAKKEVSKVMKIGFVSLYGPGHFNPMSAVARQLQSRNHDVVMLSLSFVEPLARAANLPFIAFRREGVFRRGRR